MESGGSENRSVLAEVVLRILDAAGGPSGSGSLGAYDEKQRLGVCAVYVLYEGIFIHSPKVVYYTEGYSS